MVAGKNYLSPVNFRDRLCEIGIFDEHRMSNNPHNGGHGEGTMEDTVKEACFMHNLCSRTERA